MNFALGTTASTSSLHTTTHGCFVAHLVRRTHFDQWIVNITSHKHHFTTSSTLSTPMRTPHASRPQLQDTTRNHTPSRCTVDQAQRHPRQFVHLQPPFKHFLQHPKIREKCCSPELPQHREQPSLGCTNRGPPGNNLFRTQLPDTIIVRLAPLGGPHPGYRGHSTVRCNSKQNSHVCSLRRALTNTSNTNVHPVGVGRYRPLFPRSGWSPPARPRHFFVPTSSEAGQGPTKQIRTRCHRKGNCWGSANHHQR